MESNGSPPNGNEKISRSVDPGDKLFGPLPQSEFEDENPGAYLAELGVRSWNVGWSLGNLLVTGIVAWLIASRPDSVALEVVWKLCSISCIVLLLITIWQQASRHMHRSRVKSFVSRGLTVTALVIWLVVNGSSVPS